MLDWFVHSRKLGWNSYFLCQNQVQIDKQVREALVEFEVKCRRLDRLKIPFLGSLLRSISGGLISGNLPKMHVATVMYEGIKSDRWWYKGADLYKAYDPRQKFREATPDDPRSYCLLSPWHLVGRHQQPGWLARFLTWWKSKPAPRSRLSPRWPLPPDLSPDQRWAVARTLSRLGPAEADRVYKALIERLQRPTQTSA